MARKKVSVTSESKTGRNKTFHDNYSGKNMTRKEFCKAINNGGYSNYHTRKINGVETPCSNPDSSKNNNLDWFLKELKSLLFLRGK